LLITVFKAAVWTSAGITISLLLSVIGAFISALVNAAGAKIQPISIVEQFGIGLITVFIFSWYNFEFGQPARELFQGMLIVTLTPLAGLIIYRKALMSNNFFLYMRRSRFEIELCFAFTLYIFLILLYFFHSAANGNLPIQIVGNNDIHSYVANADFLLNRDRVVQQIGNTDFNIFPKSDVFGAFIFLALSAFIPNDSAIHVTFMPMAIACGAAAAAVFGISRKIFLLDRTTSLLLGFYILCNVVFQYICFNYFLSQIMACAALLLSVYLILETFVHRPARVKTSFLALITALHTIAMIFIYPVMALPHFILLTLLGCVALSLSTIESDASKSPLLLMATAILKCMLASTLATAVSILLFAPERFLISVVRTLRLAVPNIAGWPLQPVGPLALLGYPVAWPPKSPGLETFIEWIFLFILIGLGTSEIVRSAQAIRSKQAQAISMGLFTLLSTGYLLIAYIYGSSYQQWKFAGSYTVLFSFCVPAAFLAGVKVFSTNKVFGAAKILFAGVVLAQFGYVNSKWQFVRFSAKFESLSGIDEITSSNSLYIDLPAYADRMLAANFVKTKVITFHGETYYGSGSRLDDLKPGTLALRQNSEHCFKTPDVIKLKGGFFLTTDILPTMALGDLVQFDKPDNCLYTEGVSDHEPWGAWTESRHVRLAFQLANPPQIDLGLTIKVQPFLFSGKIGHQRVVISVNGSHVFTEEISAPGPVDLSMQIPKQLVSTDMINITIELPNATSPASLSRSSDTRLLGLGLISLMLK
jgi:hypothetical protein